MLFVEENIKPRLNNAFKEGREEGLEQGFTHGLAQGRNQIFHLYEILQKENKMEDWEKALSDEAYREVLVNRYKI